MTKRFFSVTIIFLAGILFYCYEFFLRLITGAFEKDIIQHYHIHTQIGYSFLVSSYNMTYLLMQIPAGILLDRFGSKKVLTLATFLCGLGSIIFISGGYTLAILGRLLVGFGSAFAFVGVLKISREYLPQQFFAFFAGIVISLGTLAAAFSEQITVFLTAYQFSWQTLFFYSGLMALPLAIIFYFSFNLSQRNIHNKLMPNWKEAYLQIKQLIKMSPIWLNALWAGLFYLPTVILTTQYGVSYFTTLYHLSSYNATKGITLILLGWVICSPLVSYLASRTNKIKTIIIVAVLLTSITLYYLTYLPTLSKNYLYLLAFFFGLFSAGQVLVWYLFNKICPFSLSGVGIAFTNMLITAVTEVGQLTSGLLFDWHRGYPHPIQFVSGLFFIALAASALIVLFCYQKMNKSVSLPINHPAKIAVTSPDSSIF